MSGISYVSQNVNKSDLLALERYISGLTYGGVGGTNTDQYSAAYRSLQYDMPTTFTSDITTLTQIQTSPFFSINTGNGRITYTGTSGGNLHVSLSGMVALNNNTRAAKVYVGIFKNGAIVPGCAAQATFYDFATFLVVGTSPWVQPIEISNVFSISPNDYITVRAYHTLFNGGPGSTLGDARFIDLSDTGFGGYAASIEPMTLQLKLM